jgi:phosphatidate cytidylyltransferase
MTRVVSGAILAAAALAAILFLPFIGLRILVCVVAGLAAHEYATVAGGDQTGVAGAVIACWVVAGGAAEPLMLGLLLLVAVVAIVPVMTHNAPIQRAAIGALATVYVGVPLGMLAALHRLFGPSLALATIATVTVSDTAQYYTGRAFGRHALAPAISPKKTIEGAMGGVVIGTAVVAIGGASLYQLAPRTTIPFGILVVILGIVGDLFESRLKRQVGVKDSSSLIPGHGGILDRIDALLFVTPAFYLYFVGS